MSFHFRTLHLKNWLVYGGDDHTISFPDYHQGQNLVVINGQNGFGKTSLLRALQFVFHSLTRSELVDVWTDQQKQDKGELEVGLEFIHGDKLCKIVRSVRFTQRGNTFIPHPDVQMWVDGEAVADQIQDKIIQMLPKECQQFVFFDGAEITRYAHKQHEEGVKDAIERVLGIPAVRNLKADLEKLIDDLEDQQAEIGTAEQQSNSLRQDIDDLRSQREHYLERKRELGQRQWSIQRTLEELDKEASQLVAIEAERNQLADKKQRRADLEEKRRGLDAQMAEVLKQAPLYLLLPSLMRVTEQWMAREGQPIRHEKLMARRRVLEDLLEETDCLCGRPIDDQVARLLQEEITRIDTRLAPGWYHHSPAGNRELIELHAVVRGLRANPLDGTALLDQRAKLDVSLEEVEKDIADLEGKLAGHKFVEVQEHYQQCRELERSLTDVRVDLGTVEKNLTDVERDLAGKQREFDQLTVGTERGRQLTRTLQMARKAHAAIGELVERLVVSKRDRIERLTSDMFTQITNKPLEYAGVRVKGDYTLEVYRQDSSSVENAKLSAGEKEVLAYSFITALNLASPDPAPFVMDTPFGHLDSEHREGLLKSLPNLRVQVFLLATDRDLPAAERDKIAGRIASEFEIYRDQRQARSFIKEA